MKRTLFALTLTACTGWAMGQKTILSAGSSPSLFIKTGTVFSADSLVMIPSSDLTIASNTITESPVAVLTAPNPSINRVYYLSSGLTFTGTLQIWYQTSELNGNTESSLKYLDSAAGSTWLPAGSSSVNTASHYVQQTASAHTFIAATANSPTLLPLTLISFSGSWAGTTVPLQWIVEQTGETTSFTVFSSSDGLSWQDIGHVDGLLATGAHTYYFSDTDPASDDMYYRIAINEPSGSIVYSGIIDVHRPNSGSIGLHLTADHNGMHARFLGMAPTTVRILTTTGQVVFSTSTSLTSYDVGGLMPGMYFLQYEQKGKWMARSFLVP